jgi:hypothetical protein
MVVLDLQSLRRRHTTGPAWNGKGAARLRIRRPTTIAGLQPGSDYCGSAGRLPLDRSIFLGYCGSQLAFRAAADWGRPGLTELKSLLSDQASATT